MTETLFYLIASLKCLFRDRRELALENLALRQQLAILARTHLSLEKDAPTPRAIQNANLGPVVEVFEVGGLHHLSLANSHFSTFSASHCPDFRESGF
jgi:hypothetical protein